MSTYRTIDKAAIEDAVQLAGELVRTGTKWLDSATVEVHARHAMADSITDLCDPNLLAHQWAREGRIFGILGGGSILFPAYAFDASGEPVPALKAILTVLRGMSAFSIAAWFESPSSTLGGMRPRELLNRDGDKVLAAASALREGPQHG